MTHYVINAMHLKPMAVNIPAKSNMKWNIACVLGTQNRFMEDRVMPTVRYHLSSRAQYH